MTEYIDPWDVDFLVERLGFHYRERGLLLVSLASPMPVFGEDVYPEIHQKAAILIHSINHNHPLLDGNKRLSWLVTTAFYEINGCDLNALAPEIDARVRAIASGSEDEEATSQWLRARANRIRE